MNIYFRIAIALTFGVLVGLIARAAVHDSPAKLTPQQAMERLPECSPTIVQDCYTIDSHGDLFIN